jgi:hypothetical protein
VRITIERARELLGAEGDRLSDQEVAQQCRELEDYSRLLMNYYDRRVAECRRQTRPSAELEESA